MKKILTIIGARPQFIKASIVSKAISNLTSIEEIIVHTGQHFDHNMSDVFFNELNINIPKYNLGINNTSNNKMIASMLLALDEIMIKENPDGILVYGDTNSTLAGALTAINLKYKVFHVESGLRSFNLSMPEEINRILTDRVSSLLFTPTLISTQNLLNEGFNPNNIYQVGDVMYDIFLKYEKLISSSISKSDYLINFKYILFTIHRTENTENINHFRNIIEALKIISQKINVIWPIHPRALNLLKRYKFDLEKFKNIHLIEPQGYFEIIRLQKKSILVVTDSGGLQKEAFFNKVPCVTIRYETEWLELINSGWNTLVPPNNKDSIIETILSSVNKFGEMIYPFGNGNASDLIAEIIKKNI